MITIDNLVEALEDMYHGLRFSSDNHSIDVEAYDSNADYYVVVGSFDIKDFKIECPFTNTCYSLFMELWGDEDLEGDEVVNIFNSFYEKYCCKDGEFGMEYGEFYNNYRADLKDEILTKASEEQFAKFIMRVLYYHLCWDLNDYVTPMISLGEALGYNKDRVVDNIVNA